jgi:hypothetical protein
MDWQKNRNSLLGLGMGIIVGLAFGMLVNSVVLAVLVWAAAGTSMGAIVDRRNRPEFS